MKDCDYCSGSGCVYCKAEPEKIEAPEPVKGRMNFTPGEVKEFEFKDLDSAQIMADYLNRRCACNQFCPMFGAPCVTDCVCFEKARVGGDSQKARLYGFCCDNPSLMRGV